MVTATNHARGRQSSPRMRAWCAALVGAGWLAQATAAHAACGVQFQEGFEAGTLDAWDRVARSSPVVVTAGALTGARSLSTRLGTPNAVAKTVNPLEPSGGARDARLAAADAPAPGVPAGGTDRYGVGCACRLGRDRDSRRVAFLPTLVLVALHLRPRRTRPGVSSTVPLRSKIYSR
jgi:hypothetical protein